jgi:probable F420-dependent oxidoreductase
MATEALYGGDLTKILDVVALADRKGVDYVYLSDHLGFTGASHAERRRVRNFPFPLEQSWLEPISFLSAAAALTQRIRLSTYVLVAPLRPMLLLAKQIATLDVLSRGRVTMCLGAGWQDVEFEATGMPFQGRFGRLEEMVRAFRQLWTEPPANFEGKHFRLDDFYMRPTPPQGSGIPVIFGMTPTPENLARIARVADGWAADPAYVDRLEEVAGTLPGLMRAQGRDPSKLEFHVGVGPIRSETGVDDTEKVRERVADLGRKGATCVSFQPAGFCRTAADVEPFLDFIVSLKGVG